MTNHRLLVYCSLPNFPFSFTEVLFLCWVGTYMWLTMVVDSELQVCAAAAKSLQSCPILCDPIDGSPPRSPAPGILQARTLEWVAISFSKAWKWKSESEVAQSSPTLSNPMDCSLPGSSVHGIFQARVLEWGAVAFSVNKSIFAGKVIHNFFRSTSLTIIDVWGELGKSCRDH